MAQRKRRWFLADVLSVIVPAVFGLTVGGAVVSYYLTYLAPNARNTFESSLPETEVDVLFNAGSPALSFLKSGWSQPEPWGTWSDGTSAEIAIKLKAPALSDITLQLNARAYVVPSAAALPTFNIKANGTNVAALNFNRNGLLNYNVITIPRRVVANNDVLRLVFEIPGAISPKEAGVSDDHRRLGVGLTAITLQYVPAFIVDK